VARKDFLTQLASTLEWDVRHWAKRQKLLERLAPEIADMRAALQAVVAEVEASKLNDNEHFGAVFGRVIEVSEEKRQELAEAVWQDGEAARGRGEADAAAALFEKAIDARGRGLCADEDKEAQAWAKFKLASVLDDQGTFEEALALYQEALELFTEVRFQYATSMCACACIALHRGLIFHDLYVSRATGFSLPVAYILFLLLGSLFAARCLLFVFTTGGRPRPPGCGQDSREHGYHLQEPGPLRPSP
jgi:tetratricopeptide (TPR) repeat protein